MKIKKTLIHSLLAVLALCGAAAWAQTTSDKLTVPLSDPTRPSQVSVHLLNGSITVTGYEGKDILVEARVRNDGESGSGKRGGGTMKRIPMTSTGLTVEEENNEVQIGASSNQRTVDIEVKVPVHTSLNLRATNDGDIIVTNVDGELDVNDTNGDVTLNNVSGNAIAHALNGDVKVTFVRVNAQKPMAFSSMNGDIDVSFPADLKATVNLKSDNGEVYSDFDVTLQASAPPFNVEEKTGKGAKYKVKLDKTVRGTINGGGPEIQFKNFNGDIYIRKASK